MFLPNVILRSFQLLFAVIVLAISGALVHQTVFGGSPSQINFAVFIGVFAILSLGYFFLALFSDGAAHPMVLAILDALNMLFTLAGGIALAEKLHVHSCGNIHYTTTNSITNGAHDTKGRCHEAQALTAFLWFLFLTFVATVAFSAINMRKSGTGMRGTRGAPTMSQV